MNIEELRNLYNRLETLTHEEITMDEWVEIKEVQRTIALKIINKLKMEE